MCKPASQGGQRCASHTRKAVAAATERYEAAKEAVANATEQMTIGEHEDMMVERRDAGHALFQAQVEHASTPTGQRELRAALGEAEAAGDGLASMQASGLLQRGEELRERNKAIADAIKAASAQKATRAPVAPGDRAVCNACGWEGDEGDAPGGHCPKCKQDQVNYFFPATGNIPVPTRPNGKMVNAGDLNYGDKFIDPDSGDVVEVHRSYPWNGDGRQIDTTAGWSVVIRPGQKVEQVPDEIETTGDTFEDFKADQHAQNHPNALTEDEFESMYAPLGGRDYAMTDRPPIGVDAKHVWTIVEGEQDYQYAVPGVQNVNVLGYIQTEKPWTTGAEEAVWVDGSEYTD